MERRKHRRVDAQVEGFFLGNSHEVQGRTLDLSLGGARVESDLAVHPGKVILIRLVMPGSAGTLSIQEALVRWVGQQQFGVEFQGLNSEELDDLEELIDEFDDAEGSGHA